LNTSTENSTLCEKSFTLPIEDRFFKLQVLFDIQDKDKDLHEEMRPSLETLNGEIYHDIENEQTNVQCDVRGKTNLKNISECMVLSKNCSSDVRMTNQLNNPKEYVEVKHSKKYEISNNQ